MPIDKFDNGHTRLKYQSRNNFYKSTRICCREKELEFHDDLCVAFGTYKFKKKNNYSKQHFLKIASIRTFSYNFSSQEEF